jgi:hypothetical protein
MATLNIPKRDLPVLKKILELGNEQFDALISAFGDTKPTLTRGQLVKEISKKVKAIRPDELNDIFRVVFILYSMKQKAGASSQKLAEDVSQSCVESSSDVIHFESEKAGLLSSRIKKLLSFDKTIAVTTKAFDVMTEHKHTFCSARILSDIRPVFTDTPDSASAAVIIHTLQIGFHESGTGEHKEFYVALDTNDIQKLKEVIERAEKKTVALSSIIKGSKLPYLEV